MMDVFTFLYYMIYTLFTKIGNIAYKTSPITIDVNDRNALERVGILVNNGTGAMFIFWLLLWDLDFYLWMPHNRSAPFPFPPARSCGSWLWPLWSI